VVAAAAGAVGVLQDPSEEGGGAGTRLRPPAVLPARVAQRQRPRRAAGGVRAAAVAARGTPARRGAILFLSHPAAQLLEHAAGPPAPAPADADDPHAARRPGRGFLPGAGGGLLGPGTAARSLLVAAALGGGLGAHEPPAQAPAGALQRPRHAGGVRRAAVAARVARRGARGHDPRLARGTQPPCAVRTPARGAHRTGPLAPAHP